MCCLVVALAPPKDQALVRMISSFRSLVETVIVIRSFSVWQDLPHYQCLRLPFPLRLLGVCHSKVSNCQLFRSEEQHRSFVYSNSGSVLRCSLLRMAVLRNELRSFPPIDLPR